MSEKSKERQRTSSTNVYRKYTEKAHKHKSVCALKPAYRHYITPEENITLIIKTKSYNT